MSGCQKSIKPPVKKQFLTVKTSRLLIKQADRLYDRQPRKIFRVKQALSKYETVIYSNIKPKSGVYWKAARSCAFLSKQAKKSGLKSQYAEKGYKYGKQASSLNKNSAESHYYYALNLGLYADENRLEALGLLPTMEKEALESVRLNPKLEQAAAYLFLGRLYYEAPGFSVGNTEKGLKYLKKACDISPNYPPNLLSYAKILIEENQKQQAHIYIEQILNLKKSPQDNYLLAFWKKEAKKLLKKIQ